MMLYHLLFVLEDVFFFGYLLIMNVIWNMNIFLRIIEYYWYPYMAVTCVDEMSCRKGVWKFDTLWEHPLGKGEATCHSSWLYSFMHRRYVEGYYKSSSRHVYAEDW